MRSPTNSASPASSVHGSPLRANRAMPSTPATQMRFTVWPGFHHGSCGPEFQRDRSAPRTARRRMVIMWTPQSLGLDEAVESAPVTSKSPPVPRLVPNCDAASPFKSLKYAMGDVPVGTLPVPPRFTGLPPEMNLPRLADVLKSRY